MKKAFLIISVILLYGFRSGEETKVYEGIARDISSNQFIYKEVHHEIIDGGKHIKTITSFRENNEKEFARRQLDFSKSFEKPNYLLNDNRSGLLEEVKHLGENQFNIRYKKETLSSLHEKTIFVPEPAVVDGGFNYFIKNNWEQLLAGKKLEFNFISAAFQDYFTFQIYKDDRETSDGSIMLLKMEVQNFFLQLLIEPVYIYYDLDSRRIIKYEGISNIRNLEGKSYFATLQYLDLGP